METKTNEYINYQPEQTITGNASQSYTVYNDIHCDDKTNTSEPIRLIDANRLLKANGLDKLSIKTQYDTMALYEVADMIECAETIDAEPIRYGHWIVYKADEENKEHMKCSVCGAYWSAPQHAKIFKRCYNCGAKMN